MQSFHVIFNLHLGVGHSVLCQMEAVGFMSIHTCVYVSARIAHITRITQITLKTILNDALLVDDLWLGFAYFKIFVNFAANEYWLDSLLHLYAEVLELHLNIICRFLIFKRYDHTNSGSWFFGCPRAAYQ